MNQFPVCDNCKKTVPGVTTVGMFPDRCCVCGLNGECGFVNSIGVRAIHVAVAAQLARRSGEAT